MKIPTLLRTEFGRLTASKMARIALTALLLVPVLYGGLYLWANKDPYAGLDRVPAALVVEDQGATVDGQPVNYGTDVAAQVIDDGSFDWHRVSAKAAASGIADATYDFVLTLPAGFSEALVSASGENPRQGTVVLTTSDTNSFLATTIAGQAASEIRSSIAEQVGEEAADRFLLGFSTIRADLSDAADGATRLVDGTTDAADGATSLASGTAQLADGAHTLDDGLSTLAAGTTGLPAQTAELAAGAQQVADGTAKLAAAASGLSLLGDGLTGTLDAARTSMKTDLLADGLTPEQIETVLARLDQLGATIGTAETQLQALPEQLTTLASGAAAAAGGSRQLASATPALTSGIADAASGAGALASGADSAAAGTATLATGLGDVRAGASELRDGLNDGLGQIPVPGDTALQASTIANPVAVRSDELTSAENYGAGLAPFFLSLAAWIGIYALFLIIKPLSRRALTALNAPVRVTLAGWLTPALLGALQMAGLFFVVHVVLGFRMDSPLATYGFMALTSVTFAAIILALNVWFGSVGQFLGLILMVVQLVTAGGTFPWQTLPGPLATLHAVLPMSPAVDGLRQLMYGGSLETAMTDAGVLLCWLVAGLLVAAVGALRMTRYRTLRDLRPSLIG